MSIGLKFIHRLFCSVAIGKIILGIFFLSPIVGFTQHQDVALHWSSITEFKVYGSLNTFENGEIGRLPNSLQNQVREKLWKLSENTAGLYLKFKTDAPYIKITYTPGGALSFPHMPATGVSGLDLYLKQGDDFNWIRGNYAFGNNVSYAFRDIKVTDGEFWLYLPLYQSITDFKVGIPEPYTLNPIRESETSLPLIVYGTSIAQGACASRAGMAWTNILGRSLSYPVINLGFSGNGRLEPGVIEYISSFKASVFILDCMANFTTGQGLNPEAAKTRLSASIITLKKRHPHTPILMVEHAGYSDGAIQKHRYTTYKELNTVTKEVYTHLKETYGGLYLLTKEQIGLNPDSFIDGTHPNDFGMLQYAKAYKKALDSILN